MGSETSRVISILLAIAGLGVAYASLGVEVFHLMMILVVLPLGCIWYGEEIGSFSMDEEDDSHNPIGALVTYTGWILLSVMVGVIVWLATRHMPG